MQCLFIIEATTSQHVIKVLAHDCFVNLIMFPLHKKIEKNQESLKIFVYECNLIDAVRIFYFLECSNFIFHLTSARHLLII